MTTDPINLSLITIPEDLVLIEGTMLQNQARPAKIPFRVVVKNNPAAHRTLSVGIAILKTDLPRWEAYIERSKQRKEQESKWRKSAKKH